jgi:hypothetical protein
MSRQTIRKPMHHPLGVVGRGGLLHRSPHSSDGDLNHPWLALPRVHEKATSNVQENKGSAEKSKRSKEGSEKGQEGRREGRYVECAAEVSVFDVNTNDTTVL